VRFLLALVLVAGCYAPDLVDGQFLCARSDSCPAGYDCICSVCRKPGASTMCEMGAGADLSTADLSVADLGGADLATPDLATPDLARPDMSMPDLFRPDLIAPDLAGLDLLGVDGVLGLPGCSVGARSAQDPGRAGAALCPAAWTVAGVNPVTATPCNRDVNATGMNGATNCTTEDNCAVGWHVCTGETELTTNGFTATDCTNLNASNALWVTRQTGGPPMPGPGPPECKAGPGSLFGCGQFGNVPSATCTVLKRVLVNPPDAVDDCSTATQAAFLCGTAMIAESASVTKPTRDKGGVICCIN
jgi:hypothetical protein